MTGPFAPGSVAFKPYLHDELAIEDRLKELLDQAVLADEVGFDGFVLSEHHAKVLPGYQPVPTSVLGWVLAQTRSIWVAPCPTLILLRRTALVVEELAWLSAAFPNRVGVGFAAGWSQVELALGGRSTEGLTGQFAGELRSAAVALRGQDSDNFNDDAVARLHEHPLPVLSAVSSSVAARRAAETGVGMLLPSHLSARSARRFVDAYVDAGGRGRHVINRRIWVGDPPDDLLSRQLAGYRRSSGGEDEVVLNGEPPDVAADLVSFLQASGTESLILRVHLHGTETTEAREQIHRIGTELLPTFRALSETQSSIHSA